MIGYIDELLPMMSKKYHMAQHTLALTRLPLLNDTN